MLNSGILFSRMAQQVVDRMITHVEGVNLYMHLGDVQRITRCASTARDEDTLSNVAPRGR